MQQILGFSRFVSSRLITIAALCAYFTTGRRIFMFPILVLILLSGLILTLTGGLSYVAPFVYAIF